MKVLVTGAAGFIGHKVAERLLKTGNEVIGIDDLNDYYDPKLKQWRLSQLKQYKGFDFHQGDICDRRFLESLLRGAGFDAVVNLAARAGVRASIRDPVRYLRVNTEGTINLLELCKEEGIGNFVLSSTSSVYSMNDVPYSEDLRTDTPISPYGATKKAAELLSYSYHYLFGINIVVLRYFTVYGPAGRPDMSVFKFIKKIDAGEPVPVYGDGHQKRDFTYIDDIAEATVKSLCLQGYHTINLGNDNPVELLYVINLIEKSLNKKATLQFYPVHPSDMKVTWADISRARDLLGWTPKVKIEEGIERTVKWYLQNRQMVQALREAEE